MDALRHPVRALRSRKLAVWLILAVAVYSILGTVVPQADITAGGADVGRWVQAHPFLGAITQPLGLHRAYSSPLFLLLVALLAASTAACAWERALPSWRAFRRAGTVTEAELRRLREHPQLVVSVHVPEAEVLERVESSLRHARLRVRRGPKLLEASSLRAGLLGSPAFHIVLTLLFVTIALGRLSRAEGIIGVPVGSSVVDQTASYGRIEEGPLYPGHAGLRIGVTDLAFDYHDREGAQRGEAPLVTLGERDRLLARQRVYPNAPLRHGTLLIHMAGYGLAPTFALSSAEGTEVTSAHTIIDFDAAKPAGTTPGVLGVTAPDGSEVYRLNVVVPADRDGDSVVGRIPRDPRAEVSIEGSSAPPATLRLGESLALPEGGRLKLTSLGYYARLSVADDWSIYPIYLLFALAGTAMSLSIVLPYRAVHVLLASGAEGSALHVVLRHRRGDPLFAERVEAALREAAGTPASEEEESA